MAISDRCYLYISTLATKLIFIYSILFDQRQMKHIQFSITAVENRIISKYKCTGYAIKCINQKGFGQGMGATNAQNRVK